MEIDLKELGDSMFYWLLIAIIGFVIVLIAGVILWLFSQTFLFWPILLIYTYVGVGAGLLHFGGRIKIFERKKNIK